MSNSIFHRSVDTDLKKIGSTIDAFQEFCLIHLGDTTQSVDRITDLKIGLAELLNNVVLHACSSKSSHYIVLEAEFNDGGLKILLCDNGIELPANLLDVSQNNSPLLSDGDLPEKGFGWFLIHQIFDVDSYSRESTSRQNHNRLVLQEKHRPVAECLDAEEALSNKPPIKPMPSNVLL